MFLTYPSLNNEPEGISGRQHAATASDLFGKIEGFLELSRILNLTEGEEETLVSMPAKTWQAWRTQAVAPGSLAPSLLVRRLDYAIALLSRMAEVVAEGPAYTAPGKPGR